MLNQSQPTYQWNDKCILIVEDNLLTFMVLETALASTGIKIVHAEDGLKSLELVNLHPEIDLVLMDIQIPYMNGCDASREIKKMRPDLPIIAQTAHSMDDELEECMKAGSDEYVSKPIIIKSLMVTLNKYLSAVNDK